MKNINKNYKDPGSRAQQGGICFSQPSIQLSALSRGQHTGSKRPSSSHFRPLRGQTGGF